MDQQKTGAFLKTLRKEKNLTQEQLAQIFSVSTRTISRWETGSNLPDISTLVELADYYEVDLREIIDGHRKQKSMNEEVKETAQKVADYVETENQILMHRLLIINILGLSAGVLSFILEMNSQSLDPVGKMLADCCSGMAVGTIIATILFLTGTLLKIRQNMKLKKAFKLTALVCLFIIAMCFSIVMVITWSK